MLRTALFVLLALAASPAGAADGSFLATGIKVGEVTSNSAIVWVRLTAAKERVPAPFGSPPPAQRVDDAEIATLPGALPGRQDEVSLAISNFVPAKVQTVTVTGASDFTHQWRLTDLTPA